MKFATCHPDKKLYARGLCNSCYQYNQRNKNRQEYLDKRHAYYQNHKEENSAYGKRYQKEHKKEVKQMKQNWNLSHLTNQMLWAAKRRAKKKGIKFSLTVEDIFIPTFCPLLGIPLVKGNKGFQKSSPTLDRIYNDKGYVPGNVRVISGRANRLKSDATLEELELLTSNLRKLANA